MIVELFVQVLGGIVAFIGTLFGDFDLPGWWLALDAQILTLGSYMAGYGAWLPISEAVTAATFVMVCLALGLVIKVVRLVLSLFTGGGGSAA